MSPGASLASLPAIALLVASCAERPVIEGRWLGDLRLGESTQRIEITVDSGGESASVSLAAWGLEKHPANVLLLPGDSLLIGGDTGAVNVSFRGPVRQGAWAGIARRGADSAWFALRRLYAPSDLEWVALVGTYRTADGGLIGIAPFSEFGAGPQIVNYSTGRIGPLHPIAHDRFLVGHSLITPMFPADTLELSTERSGEVRSIRLTDGDRPLVSAERLATRDEPLTFGNGPVTLAGMLTLPEGPGPHPAMVLVHGSNALTRDVFGPWTRYFAGLGFAVLAYDKRGTGASTGDWKAADFAALGGDVIAGVRALAARTDIRADRIGLWGASQAGWIMPLVAAAAPEEIAFLIVHAGSGTTVRQEGVLYLRNELRFAGLPEGSVAVGTRYQELDDAVSRTGRGFAELQRYYDTQSKVETWLWPPRPADDWFRPYYKMLMDFDPVPYWRRVVAPVLLFFGELDANVPPEESWPPIERALREGGNERVTQVLLPRANHLFFEARTGGRDEYPGLNRFVPGYFDRMAEWLRAAAR